MRRLLLCTDLDRTWIPNGSAAQSPRSSEYLARLLREKQVALAYVTGRHQALIQQAIEEYDLPLPNFAIADVGATIYKIVSGNWEASNDWSEQLSQDWCDTANAQLLDQLAAIPELTLQESEKQGRFKISFYLPMQADLLRVDEQIGGLLNLLKMKTNRIWSIDEANRVRLLDLLPEQANKRKAMEHLLQTRGFKKEDTIFAGDSGNDLDVFESDIPSVVVANASPEIKAWATTLGKPSLYLAEGGLLGMNGNYQAGILEGLVHYWPEAKQWLKDVST